jgi:mRNA interferase RelE/StbE
VKKLKSFEGFYRIRVGDYRVVYSVEEQLLLLLVVTAGHRRDVYRKLAEKYDRERLLSIVRDENSE